MKMCKLRMTRRYDELEEEEEDDGRVRRHHAERYTHAKRKSETEEKTRTSGTQNTLLTTAWMAEA